MQGPLWDVLKIVIQVLLVAGVGVVGHFLRKTLNGINERLTVLEERERQGQIGSILADGKIRESVLRDHVGRNECTGRHAELRDTTVRLFAKVEDLQRGQARQEAKLDAVADLVRNGGKHGPR